MADPTGMCSLSPSPGHMGTWSSPETDNWEDSEEQHKQAKTWETRQHKEEEAPSVYPSLGRVRGDMLTLC